jgi:stage V sporulation protein R
MILDSLYHPPYIEINQEQEDNNSLYLVHGFEGKPLVKDFITNTLIGIEYLWGGPVKLETSELEEIGAPTEVDLVDPWGMTVEEDTESEFEWRRVVYTMENRKLSRKVL